MYMFVFALIPKPRDRKVVSNEMSILDHQPVICRLDWQLARAVNYKSCNLFVSGDNVAVVPSCNITRPVKLENQLLFKNY